MSALREYTEEYMTALGNIAELYSFLTPVLPSVAETERTIDVYRRAGQEESNNKDKTNNTMIMEDEDLNKDMETEDQGMEEMEEMSTSEEEEGENDETDEEVNDGNRVSWDMSHLSKEEKEKEDKRMETDVAYAIAPGVNIHEPNDEFNPDPSIQPQEPHKGKKKKVPGREPRRSARPRAEIPARYRD